MRYFFLFQMLDQTLKILYYIKLLSVTCNFLELVTNHIFIQMVINWFQNFNALRTNLDLVDVWTYVNSLILVSDIETKASDTAFKTEDRTHVSCAGYVRMRQTKTWNACRTGLNNQPKPKALQWSIRNDS